MENLVKDLANCYSNKNVFVTGHTGFKGSWLVAICQYFKAHITGYALAPDCSPNHYSLLPIDYISHKGDILNLDLLKENLNTAQPEIIFHLAAQSLVRRSYELPINTYQTNVIGTLNVLEAARSCSSVRAVVVVTTDKVYENKEQDLPYNESDELGGYDMYSSSKACCELLVNSYRRSFLNPSLYGIDHNILIATVRAGNVIGGGDWSMDRLIPDIVKATARHEQVVIRNPNSIRPWQHVMDCLTGYLLLGKKLLEQNIDYTGSWNFSPESNDSRTVEEILNYCKNNWNDVDFAISSSENEVHESKILKLSHEKSARLLNWQTKWNTQQAVEMTIAWYKSYYMNHVVKTNDQISKYFNG